ncbi:MAG TPA: ASKHA domain-containing protein [Patescibacteria group bacterium]|nr:ASKHA domain-containing protein [Patescibacteria group bacterium]
MEKIKVTFYPDRTSVEVAKGEPILSALSAAGIHIHSACGGNGGCGRCKVKVKSGKVCMRPTGLISPEERSKGIFLACLTSAESDLEVEVPQESRQEYGVLSPEEIDTRLKGIYAAAEDVEAASAQAPAAGFTYGPLATKVYMELLPPDLNDKTSDLERLERQIRFVVKNADNIAVSNPSANLTFIRELGKQLRSANWKVTVTLGKRANDALEMLLIEPQDTTGLNYGICFDIGTTTLSAQLIDLNNGTVLGTRGTYNKQATFGSDVISRIVYAHQANGLEKLHQAVIEELNRMAYELILSEHIPTNSVNYFVCAGNTTMTQLLLRVDPTYIRKEPYVPTANFFPVVNAHDEGFKLNQHALLACVPGVSSYVGGDVTAGVLSSGLDTQEHLCMLIDIGTNGEIVVGNKEFLISAAASAGPAFEGSGVACGMRASPGAIQKVKISPRTFEVSCEVIGKILPQGICGSGYIDAISGMLQAGLLDKNGKIRARSHPRIRQTDSGKEFVLVHKEDCDTAYDIVITEADIENIKRAKAAIYSAGLVLLKHMGFQFSDVYQIFIAGGFGTYLDMESAIHIGLLPDLERSRFVFIGNSSLAGARQILLSEDALKKADAIARKMTYFELSVEPGYMDEYMAALFFPHTDLSKFASIRYGV